MLAFIDESDCPGFKLTRGSDAVFAIGMVIFESREDALRTAASMTQFRARTGHRHEIKFAKSSDKARDAFFEAVRGCPFRLCVLVVEKDQVQDPFPRGDHEAFYGFFVGELVRRAASRLKGVKLSVDGSGSALFRRAVKRRLRKDLCGRLADLRFVDSRRDDFIQLADMCVGAVARAYRFHADGDRWLKSLQARIDEIWDFR
ncbi:MAG: DUF3800 domain-containing protein [Gammaproteobacteria bacterium]